MLSTDIPAVEMVQCGLFDALTDREELAREAPSLPLSERAILRHEDGSDKSGNRRALFREEVDATLAAFFHVAKESEGYDSAVLMLFRMVSRDADYVKLAPPWMRQLFEEERDLLMSAFWSNALTIELGESQEQEDE